MKKAIRLTVALMAALAFGTALAADEKAEKKCEAKDMPCATVVVQDGSPEEVQMAAGSGAGEPYGSDEVTDELYKERWKHEIWEGAD